MKQYLIKNTDIMLNGKVIPEGSTIELDENEAISLSDYLVTLSASSRAETRDKVLPTINKAIITNNKKRSK